jgi:hypothetical protein
MAKLAERLARAKSGTANMDASAHHAWGFSQFKAWHFKALHFKAWHFKAGTLQRSLRFSGLTDRADLQGVQTL